MRTGSAFVRIYKVARWQTVRPLRIGNMFDLTKRLAYRPLTESS